MRGSIAVLLALLLVACGGGGGDSPQPPPAPTATPLIQYEGVYAAGSAPTLTLQPLAGQAGIAGNAVARVELQTNNETPQVLTAANASGGRYVFTVPNYPAQFQFRNCTTVVPMRVTVTDATGFSFTKNMTYCPAQPVSFGAFSDYGDRVTRFTGSASTPATASASRVGQGGYSDAFHETGVTSFDRSVMAREGDVLSMAMQGSPGALLVARAEGQGAFAESQIAANDGISFASVALGCCRLTPAPDAPQQLRLEFTAAMFNVSNPPPAAYQYTYRVMDPATGAVLQQQSGSGTDFGRIVIDVRGNQQVTVEAGPADPRTTVQFNLGHLNAGGTDAPMLAGASSNRVGVPARATVFCCTR